MRFLLALFVSFIAFFPDLEAKNPDYRGSFEYGLSRWKSKKNVLLIFAPTPKSSEFLKQREAIQEEYKFFRERDAVVYFVFEDEEGRADDLKLRVNDGRDLRKRFKISDGSFSVVLVNKAGEIKAKKSEVLSLDALGQLIKKK